MGLAETRAAHHITSLISRIFRAIELHVTEVVHERFRPALEGLGNREVDRIHPVDCVRVGDRVLDLVLLETADVMRRPLGVGAAEIHPAGMPIA